MVFHLVLHIFFSAVLFMRSLLMNCTRFAGAAAGDLKDNTAAGGLSLFMRKICSSRNENKEEKKSN